MLQPFREEIKPKMQDNLSSVLAKRVSRSKTVHQHLCHSLGILAIPLSCLSAPLLFPSGRSAGQLPTKATS